MAILEMLPVKFCVCFKILVFTLQAYHGVSSAYLCELIKKHHAVKSNNMMLLLELKVKYMVSGLYLTLHLMSE